MRYELTDFEWAAIRSLLPNKPRGIPRVDDRRVLNGIFWVLRSGAPWRDLPETYGPRTTGALMTTTFCSRSVHLDVGRLDHRPPFCNFRLLPVAERFRREFFAWRHLQSQVFELLAHGRIVQCIDRRRVEFCDDVLRRAFRHPQTGPQRHVKPWQPGFVRGRNV